MKRFARPLVRFAVVGGLLAITTSIVGAEAIRGTRDAVEMATGTGLRKGPYLLYYRDDPSEMRVQWQLDATATCTVRWGQTPDCEAGALTTAENAAGPNEHMHAGTLTNLQSDTVYHYQVTVADGATHTAAFRTPPLANATQARLLVCGDTQNDNAQFDALCALMLTDATAEPALPPFLLHLGDVVDNGKRERDWTGVFHYRRGNIRRLMASIPTMAVRGNHEQDGVLFRKYIGHEYPKDRDARVGCYYSFDWGPLHVIVLDQWQRVITEGSDQHTWFARDIAASTKRWNIVAVHAGVYDQATDYSKAAEFNRSVLPYCVKDGVQLVLAGHRHTYGHVVVEGIHHVISGGGSHLHRDVTYPGTIHSRTENHFTRIEIDGDTLTCTAIRPDGSVLDRFEIPSRRHRLMATSGEGGRILPAGEQFVKEASRPVFAFQPHKGYELQMVVVDGRQVPHRGEYYRLDEIRNDRTLHAVFARSGSSTSGKQE